MLNTGSVFVRRLAVAMALAVTFAVGALQQSASAATNHQARVTQSVHEF